VIYPDNAKSFYESIPRDIPANIAYRMKLHDLLAGSKNFQDTYKAMILEDPKIAFNSAWFTYDPQQPAGFRDVPFVLREAQEEAIDAVDHAYRNQYDLAIDKARKEGATELLVKYFTGLWWLEPGFCALVGSRKKEFVDTSVEIINMRVQGTHKSLFHKICYAVVNMPRWGVPNFQKTSMRLENLDNGSSIGGESTNENFGAGDRASISLVDEHGRMDYTIAQSVVENLSDTCNCNIYNSTHFYGTAHPYNQLLISGKVKVVILNWERNPLKNQGLYKSPDYDEVTISDLAYYRNISEEAFSGIEKDTPFTLSKFWRDIRENKPHLLEALKKVSFIADGGDANDGGWRSKWYDAEEKRRTSRRDMAQNVDRNPVGSGDMFFSPVTLRRLRAEHIQTPTHTGEIKFKKNEDESIIKTSCILKTGLTTGRMQWWGPLIDGRPDQSHNFIIGSDISVGTGASNSVHLIYDVNTQSEVGIWVCPNTPPESFADVGVALAYWTGGNSGLPYMIWENNGPGGAYGKRIQFYAYPKVYVQRDERARKKTEKNAWGWHSSLDNKIDLLQDLDIALGQAIRGSKAHSSFMTHDEGLVGELESYINFEAGGVGPAKLSKDSSGARKAHGDRVIPAGLVLLALRLQPKGVAKDTRGIPKDCIAYRRQQREMQEARDKENRRW